MYANDEFSGYRKHDHGGTENQHMEALRKMGANIPEKQVNDIPRQLIYLYDTFMDLRFSVIPSGEGFSRIARQPLTLSDVDFYSRAKGLQFHLWEINAIMSLDSIYERATN